VGIPSEHVRIAKVVGENDEGLTLFVPKSMTEGVFHLTEGDSFLTLIFAKNDGEGSLMTWLPWEGEDA